MGACGNRLLSGHFHQQTCQVVSRPVGRSDARQPLAPGAGRARPGGRTGLSLHPVALACGVLIRKKHEADDAECLRLLMLVHADEGYPLHLAPDEVPAFFSAEHEEVAWVAELQGVVVGHVALHWAADDPTLAAVHAATGLPMQQLYLLARLFTAPRERRRGLGRLLLRHAVEHARALERRVVLDVGQTLLPAIHLYESEGWMRLGELHPPLDDARTLDLWVYLSPAGGTKNCG